MYHHRAAFSTTSGFVGGCSPASPRVMDSISSGTSAGSTSADCVLSISTGISSIDRDGVGTLLLTHWKSPLRAFEGAPAPLGARKQVAKSRRGEVDALLAGDLLQVVPVTVAEVALVAAVSTDCASVVFSDERAATCSPDVCLAFGAGGFLEIGWARPPYSMCNPASCGVVSGQIPWDFQNSRIRARLWRTVFRTVT